MAKWGSFDFDEFEQLAKSFKTALEQRVIERWIREFLLEMAYRAERKIKKRTPVDSGELRQNWRVGKIVKKGDAYEVEIYNNTDYASYVEHGHRAGKNSTSWVEGRFMMTISMKEMEQELPKFIEKKQIELIDNLMNGRPTKPSKTGYGSWSADVKKADAKRERKQKRDEAKKKKDEKDKKGE
ncbi:HK97 gp10 family phage protein [Paenibacillus sp. FSL R5-0407]|uniref:HK97 gp10 family phage protein n=1 Tax=Paenibacillus sp. FSL R5-0407 TaxID=2975320 RepID=UPI0030FA5C83